MSGKVSMKSPYLLRDRNKKLYHEKKIILDYGQQTDTSDQNKLKIYSFVEKCLTKAQMKKTKGIKNINLTPSMRNSYSGM